MGYLKETREWLTELLYPFITDDDEAKLKQVVDEIAAEILTSYKNGLRDAKKKRRSKRAE